MTEITTFEEYHRHLFEAAQMAAKHFFEIEPSFDDKKSNIKLYASQKAHQFEALIKLFADVEKGEAICPLEDIKFKAYRVDMKIDEWD